MVEIDTYPWREFQALAIRYPNCEGIRLVKGMQRAFIEHQQRQIAKDLAAILGAAGSVNRGSRVAITPADHPTSRDSSSHR